MARYTPSTYVLLIITAFVLAQEGTAFAPTLWSRHPQEARLFSSIDEKALEGPEDEPRMNPLNPNLPEVKGDFDWDTKYANDDDWITTDVPGKIVLDEVTLAAQTKALQELEAKWRREREIEDYEEGKTAGFVANAEMINGRFAMFFLVTGLLTEYWTGVSMPGQVEELLRIGGFIGFD